MLKELWMRKTLLGCLVLVVALIHPLAAAAKGECYDPDYIGGAIGGGFAGMAAGGLVAAATGLGVTSVGVGATASGAAAVGIAVGCATTACIVPALVGIGVGAAAALAYLAGTNPKDCAGAIYFSPKRETFSAVYDRDSNLKAAEDGKEYCERKGGTCLWKTTFRKCAAVAKDYENRKWGIGQFSSAKESEQEALAVCKASGGKNCTIVLSVCNSG